MRHVLSRARGGILVVSVVLTAASLPMNQAQALSCLPTSPIVGAVKNAPRNGSGGTIIVDLTSPATFYDSLVVSSGAAGQTTADVDAYAVLLQSYATTGTQAGTTQVTQRTTLSLTDTVKTDIAVKKGDVIAQGPPFHVCGYSLTAIGNAKGKLKTLVTTHGYGTYRFNASTLTVSAADKISCTQGACTASVGIRLGKDAFTLNPGAEHTFDSGPLVSMKLISSSIPDVTNPADPAAVLQRDPWGLLTYAVIVMDVRDGFTPQEAPLPFSDVPPTHPYAGAIAAVRDAGLMTGNGDGTFRPDDAVNRAELTKILVTKGKEDDDEHSCKLGKNDTPFTDIDYDAWYGSYVCAAQQKKLVTGYPDGTFKPSNQISFAETTALIARAYNLPVLPDARAWYMGYYYALESRGAVPPTVRSFEQTVTRAEIAYILSRLTSGF